MDVNLYVESNNGDFTLRADGTVITDTTLTKSGMAADAKATGDAIRIEETARTTADADLQTQIDQIITPGGAPSEAEVTNARIGADSTVYDSLGDAIRGQVKDLSSLNVNWFEHKINNTVTSTYTTGMRTGYWNDSGSRTNSNNYLMVSSRKLLTGYPNVKAFRFIPKSGYTLFLKFYNGSTLISKYEFTDDGFSYIPSNATHFAVYIGTFSGNAGTYNTLAFIADFHMYCTFGIQGVDDTLSDFEKSANAYSTGALANSMNFFKIDVKESFGSEHNPTGWRKGRWGSDGEITSDDISICLTGRAGFSGLYKGVKAMRIKWPTGTEHNHLSILRFSYTQAGLLEEKIFRSGVAIIPIYDNDRIALTLTNLNYPNTDYLTDAFTSQITIEYLFNEKANNTKTSEFIRFNVPINLRWPDVDSTTTDDAESDTEVDLRCILALPSDYTPGGRPCPLIMYGHGASSQITGSTWYGSGSAFLTLIRKFTSAGYAVFDVNNTRDDPDGYPDWGGLPLMEGYIKAWQYIKAHYNVEDNLYLLSCSMGTCANLMMMKWYPSKIIASIMTAPRPICQNRYDTITGDYKTLMAQSFGLTGGVWDNNRLGGFNHWENIVEIDSTPYILEKFPPIKVMVGAADTDFLTETREYYQAVKNNGNFVDYREVTGATHNEMCNLTLGDLKDEALAFFERFRQKD